MYRIKYRNKILEKYNQINIQQSRLLSASLKPRSIFLYFLYFLYLFNIFRFSFDYCFFLYTWYFFCICLTNFNFCLIYLIMQHFYIYIKVLYESTLGARHGGTRAREALNHVGHKAHKASGHIEHVIQHDMYQNYSLKC